MNRKNLTTKVENLSIMTEDDIKASIKEIYVELRGKYGDIHNIDLEKAVDILKYCADRMQSCDKQKQKLSFAYWSFLTVRYNTAVGASFDALKKLREEELREEAELRELFGIGIENGNGNK